MASLYDKLSEEDKGKLLYYGGLYRNAAPEAIELVRENLDKVHLSKLNILCAELSRNTAPEAIELLRGYIDKADWLLLSRNQSEAAVDLLRHNLDKISRIDLCSNSSAMALITTTVLPIIEPMCPELSGFFWYRLSTNPAAVPYFESNLNKVNWSGMATNPAAIHLLKDNLNMLNPNVFGRLAKNTNPAALDLLRDRLDELNDTAWEAMSLNPAAITILEENPDKVNWNGLSANPAAIHLLKQNIRRIRWGELSKNSNPEAISLIESRELKGKLPKTIDWIELSRNPAAIYFLESHLDKVDWHSLAQNPELFKTEYLMK